nr:dynamin-related protein 3A [Tanacetum cinerariifolium]
MSHRCMANELQRFAVLRKRMDDVIGNFLRDGLQPSKTMIGNIVEMEMDYINTSRLNFIGGSKAVEMAIHQVKSSKISTTIQKQKDAAEPKKAPQSERGTKYQVTLHIYVITALSSALSYDASNGMSIPHHHQFGNNVGNDKNINEKKVDVGNI